MSHTIHVVVPSSGPSSPSSPKARLSSSAPSPSVEVTSSMGSSSHRVISPVVAVVPSALARWWAHHAWPSAGIERWSVTVRGRGMVETRPARGVVGWVATVHGHLHVHVHVVHVVHIVHAWTVAQQALVN